MFQAMDSAMKSMNLEQISTLMDKFEKEFEDLDVQTSVMEGAMSQTTATNIPTDAVDVLMKQAADEAGIELSHELPSAASNTIGTAQQVATAEPDELSQRLARLRQVWGFSKQTIIIIISLPISGNFYHLCKGTGDFFG